MEICFDVYRDGQRVAQPTMTAAMAVAPESVPVPAEVRLRDGQVRVAAPEQPLGLALLWDCGAGCGAYHLETTRLVPRLRPYVLNLELARCRVMKLLQKFEDWALLDTPAGEPFVVRLAALQAELAAATGQAARGDGAGASVHADRVLAGALALSRDATLGQAQHGLDRRAAAHAFPRHMMGGRVDPSDRSSRAKELAADALDMVVLPLRWRDLQPAEGQLDTAAVDAWVEYLAKRKIPVIAGPLIDLREDVLPDWLVVYEDDPEALRNYAFEYARAIVGRYRRLVSVWNVASGLTLPGLVRLTLESAVELTRQAVAQVRSVHPQARTVVTVRDPFGEGHGYSAAGAPPVLYAEMVGQAVNCDGIAVEFEAGMPGVGGAARDLFQYSCQLDRLSAAGKPIFVTGVSAPGRDGPSGSDRSGGKHDPRDAGRPAGGAWSPAEQAGFLGDFFRVAAGKPFVESLAWGDLGDEGATAPEGGLFDGMMRPKPSGERFAELRAEWGKYRR